MSKFKLFSPWPSYSKEETEAVKKVLLSNKVNFWTGEECRKFESEFAKFVNSKFAISLANGTVALDAALKALEIGNGDEVVVTSRTFIASVSSIINAGAKPVFADIDPTNQNITSQTIEKVLTQHTKAVICVHLAGWPCDMDQIMQLARSRGLYVIEDCAQAHGAKYKNQSVGTIGDIGCWSFCQDKIMTTGGEGGMVTTNSRKLWLRMWSLKDHGKSWEAVFERDHPSGFRWLHESFGTNWRMTEMQAAIGRIQLKRLPEWQKLRLKNANQIWSTASKLNKWLSIPELTCQSCNFNCNDVKKCEHAAYKCYVFVKGSQIDRDQIMHKLNNEGVPCFSGSCSEVYLEKAFENHPSKPKERLDAAKKLGETSLMFLCHPTLKEVEIDKTCEMLEKVVKNHFE